MGNLIGRAIAASSFIVVGTINVLIGVAILADTKAK